MFHFFSLFQFPSNLYNCFRINRWTIMIINFWYSNPGNGYIWLFLHCGMACHILRQGFHFVLIVFKIWKKDCWTTRCKRSTRSYVLNTTMINPPSNVSSSISSFMKFHLFGYRCHNVSLNAEGCLVAWSWKAFSWLWYWTSFIHCEHLNPT